MHELAIMESVTDVVLAQMKANGASRVLNIWMEAGEMRNLEEPWVNRFFNQCAEGTAAEGATVHVKRVPVEFKCCDCGSPIAYVRHNHSHENDHGYGHAHGHLECPKCGSHNYKLSHGTELSITGLELA